MNTEHTEQNGDEDIFDALAHVESGYVEITQPDGAVNYLFVNDFKMGPNLVVSVGFASDCLNAEGRLGKPVFLHKRMQIRHLGNADEYVTDSLVQKVVSLIDGHYPSDKGLMPLLRTVEMVRSGRVLLADAPVLLGGFLE